MPYFTITGTTPKKRRLDLVNAFNDDDTPVFLVSLKAGGTGLNLTGASVVVHADPWWNAAAQNQATDRAHRIGQTRSPIREHRQIAPSKRIVDHAHLLSRRNDEPHIPPHLASSFSNTVVRYTPSSCTVSNVPS